MLRSKKDAVHLFNEETAITLWQQHKTYFYGKKVSERTDLNFESTLKTDELHKMEYFG